MSSATWQSEPRVPAAYLELSDRIDFNVLILQDHDLVSVEQVAPQYVHTSETNQSRDVDSP